MTSTTNQPTEPNITTDVQDTDLDFTRAQLSVVCVAILIIALCGIVYELLIATISSYLIGNSVYQFSVTVGLFMAAMGIGSYLSQHLRRNLIDTFVLAEVALAIIGGLSSVALFAVFPISKLYSPVVYTLILIIGSLIGLEIPIVVRILAQHGGVRRGVADALSLDYIGALIGSLAFPLLMLPYLGLFHSSFAIGLLNAVVAIITAIVFRKHILRPRLLTGAGIAAVILLFAAFAFSSQITRYSESQLYGGRIITHQQTPYQRIVLTRDDTTGEHRLYLDGHIQFAEYDEYRYHEALVHPVLAAPGDIASVLILGGGDGLAIREVLRFAAVQKIILVDLDPAITDLARSFPPLTKLNQHSLDDPKVTVVNDDAFTYVRKTNERFDRVIIDLPDPHNEALAKLYSVEFYRMIRAILNPNGTLVTQATSPYYTAEAYWSIRDSIRAAGFNTLSYHVDVPAFGIWGFHLAREYSTPSQFNFLPDARFMNNQVMAAAQVFAPDQQPHQTRINSIFEPGIYLEYRQGLLRGRPDPNAPLSNNDTTAGTPVGDAR